ncbi:hypothetical protein [Patulibacter minatonensis]|uniref:hypothetical protein n=1 Tax=Patulibacter minatonensis TaxID=298163 RepID=UPI00047E9036|nr:hypothetical protein [Patulibacter minatonensis]
MLARSFFPFSRPPRTTRGRLGPLLVAVSAAAAIAVMPATAGAAACPAATATTTDILVTQGVDDRRTTLTRQGRPRSDYPVDFRQTTLQFGLDEDRLYGDGDSKQPFVRDDRDRRGRRHVTLCVERGRLAVLPSPARGTRLAGVSVGGAFVAWRTTRGARGSVHVGRIVGGRVKGVRQTSTVPTRAGRAVDGRLQVSAHGDVAWALTRRSGDARRNVWAWSRGGSVKALRRPSGVADPHVVRVADDQHVALDGSATLLRFAPAVKGRCPRVDATRWSPLAGLRVADIGGATDAPEARKPTEWAFLLVCDPSSGALRRVVVTRGDGVAGHTRRVVRVARTGSWLLVERTLLARSYSSVSFSYSTEILRLGDRSTTTVPGGLAGPGIPGPPTYPGRTGRVEFPVGAVVRPGAVAWTTPISPTSDPARSTLTLVDAAGRRDVGTTTTTPSFMGDALTWTDGADPRTDPVRPAPGEQAAVATLQPNPY